MSLTDHVQAIRRRLWLILGLSLLVALVVYFVSSQRAERFSATTTIDVLADTESGDRPVSQEEVQVITGRFAALAETTSVIDAALDVSNVDMSIEDARSAITAEADETSGFVTVTAKAASAIEANDLSEGVAEALVDRAGGSAAGATVVVPAEVPSSPIEPKPRRDALFAFILAFIVNAEIVAIATAVADRLRPGNEDAEVEALVGAPVLALVPRRRKEWAVEALRTLRSSVELATADHPARSVTVTGMAPGAGASYVAFGLAQATANSKMSVALVDAHLRRPKVTEALGVPPEPNLVEAIRKGTLRWDALSTVNPLQNRFRVLPAGTDAPDPGGLLGSGGLSKVLDQLSDAELIVVDAPPLQDGVDAVVIATQTDGVILVVEARKTKKRQIARAADRLTSNGIRIIGAVINGVAADSRTRPARWTRRPADAAPR